MMEYQSLEEIFQAFSRLKVLIIGDVMIDSYLWGKVDRISPEAPVPVVHVQKREKRLGGAANVALNVQALGATPILCAVIGRDDDASTFMELLNQKHMQHSGIVLSTSRATTIKHRILSGSQHMLRIDSETDAPLTAEENEKLLEKIKKLMKGCDVVVFEDYDKGVLNHEIITETIAFARELKIPTIVDPKKRNFFSYKNVSLFKPNLKEMREGMKTEIDMERPEELYNAANKLTEEMELSGLLVTLSEKGVFIKQNGEEHIIPAHTREISDVSGAGDTVTSIAALCLGLKLSPYFTAALSNLGGGLVCEHVGVVPIEKASLMKEAKAANLI